MANFFLIDHSLRKFGGHHFDYVQCVARAANELGFLTTIGANRRLKRSTTDDRQNIDRLGNVRRVFRKTTYQPDSYLAGLQHLTRSDSLSSLNENFSSRPARYWQTLMRLKHRLRREKFVRNFATDCERYFRPQLQMPGDHAFLTTVSELELMGLAVYLSNHAQTLKTHWHLQFHFNLFDGRTPEYDGQEYILQAIRACFLAAMARLSYHSIHFYTTSDTLVDQYRRLGVGEFQLLPYPVSRDFTADNRPQVLNFGERDLATVLHGSAGDENGFPSRRKRGIVSLDSSQRSDSIVDGQEKSHVNPGSGDDPTGCFHRPLRITCPGEVRREKGSIEYLQPLVDQIWSSHLSTGNVQIVVQRPKKKWHAKQEKIAITLPDEPNSVAPNASPIEYFSHPLDHDDYVELIKSTDCGLLFYDSRVYFSRRAGVLGELLACGKPVIVPAGSWLSEQIAEPIFQHVDNVVKHSPPIRSIDSRDFGWKVQNVPMPGGVLSFDKTNHPFDFSLERDPGENAMVFEFDWHWPKAAGIYCRLEMKQKDKTGEVVATSRRVLGYRSSTRKVNSLFELDPETRVVEFSLTNAYHHSTASINRARILTLNLSTAGSQIEMPIGSVGVVAADQEDLPNCIDEIVKHFDHYRESAMAFSRQWYSQHDPQRTVNHLFSVSQPSASSMRRVA